MSALATPPRFWDQRAAAYAKQPIRDESAYAQTLERVRAHLATSARVLEIGCGTGTTALALAANAGHILATDYSAEMIGIAADKARAAGVTNVEFRTTTLDDPALASESFDVVMALNFLHLIEDVPAVIRRIRGLVRPGGIFVSKTPCVGDQGLLPRVAIPVLRALGRAPFVNFVTERALADGIRGEGFEVVETGMYPRKTRSFFVVAKRAGASRSLSRSEG